MDTTHRNPSRSNPPNAQNCNTNTTAKAQSEARGVHAASLRERVAQSEARAKAFRLAHEAHKALMFVALASGDPQRIRVAHEVTAQLLLAAVSR